MQLLRKILWPLSFIYAVSIQIRNWTYDLGLRSTRKFGTPTISVGNLSLGGTGKTPMIEWLIRNFKDYKNIAVLSRGYKRKTSGFIMAEKGSTSESIGDEPLQIYTKFPSVTVAVDGNRRRGISILEERIAPQVILLDDAFQHRKVIPDFSILLTAYENLYTEDWYLPSGTLRDLKSQARRANIIIVTKCPDGLDDLSMDQIIDRLGPKPHQQVLFCALEYAEELKGNRRERDLDEFQGLELTVVTGIANPEPMIKFLKEKGIGVRHLRFGDHHHYKSKELDKLKGQMLVLTTEKDYVRGLKYLDNIAYLEIQHKFLGDGKARLLKALSAAIK